MWDDEGMCRYLGVVAVLTTACGRIGFDEPSALHDVTLDGAVLGHDEDLDGVPDALDDCPQLAVAQLDTDGDGVGDACDWEPTNPRQHRALFATFTATDQPFQVVDGSWTQLADALRFDGVGHGALTYALPMGDVQIELVADLREVVGANLQHQFAFNSTRGTLPDDFVELNEILPALSNAAISRYDGVTYTTRKQSPLSSQIHAGQVTLRATQLLVGSTTFEAAWPAEAYRLVEPASVYAGGTQVELDINNLDLELRYLSIVTGS